MTTQFIGDAEIGAGRPPFRTMRRDASTSGARMGQQMGQLVPKSAIDLGLAILGQPAVQNDFPRGVFCPAGSRTQPRRPFDRYPSGQLFSRILRQEHSSQFFERLITAGLHLPNRIKQGELKLERQEQLR
jgi:hypothetical protein